MASKNLMEVLAATNTGEDNDNVFARLSVDGKNTEVSYMAYGGIRSVELTGNLTFADISRHTGLVKELHDKVGDDCEVMLAIDTGDGIAVISVDSMDQVVCVGADCSVKVESSQSFDTDDMEDPDENLTDLMTALDL